MMDKNKSTQIQKASDKLFKVLELYEDEPIIFHNSGKQNREKQITKASISNQYKNMCEKKRKIMLVIPSR
jgi:hypothetical protein